jgi:hypothetical protein
MSAILENIEQASSQYSSTFTKGSLALPPAKKYLVLTCMDARIDPAAAFGIELGDAHVIRNVKTSLRNVTLGARTDWVSRPVLPQSTLSAASSSQSNSSGRMRSCS